MIQLDDGNNIQIAFHEVILDCLGNSLYDSKVKK